MLPVLFHFFIRVAGGPVSYVSYEELGTPFDEDALLTALAKST